MAEQPKRNFLLGRGEALTAPVNIKKGSGTKKMPYSFDEARQFLIPKVESAVKEFSALPEAACPADIAVGLLTLHPAFLAKSYFPAELLSAAGFTAVGSRAAIVTPRKWTRDGPPEPSTSPEIFVAAPRVAFERFSARLPTLSLSSQGGADLMQIEDFRPVTARDRLKPLTGLKSGVNKLLMEVVLHVVDEKAQPFIVDGFRDFLAWLNLDFAIGRSFTARGLQFMSLECPGERRAEIAQYSFMRACREMPSLRHFRVDSGSSPTTTTRPGFVYDLPTGDAIDTTASVAVFDGGMPYLPRLARWVNVIDAPGVGKADARAQEHGLAVTSALLFGPLENGKCAPTPYSTVDHYRVIDEATAADPQKELYNVLGRITTALDGRHYDFVNLSVGPNKPVEDDDLDAWTVMLDARLSAGTTLLSSAVGNEGLADAALRFNRIQPPADCVNALAVGATNSLGGKWARADYSCVGPGRSPGRVKPDLMAFGGSPLEPFFVIGNSPSNFTAGKCGTSYAAPFALRAGVGIRAHLGDVLKPLALRALLIHRCRTDGNPVGEVGRGRIAVDLEDLVVCAPGTVTVAYQGFLDPKQYMRVFVPFPARPVIGKVFVTATICFATDTDPKDPINYTRSGLDAVFRPHRDIFAKPGMKNGKLMPKPKHAKPHPFFSSTAASHESELRDDEHKWETVMHASHKFNTTRLLDPVLDIHYNPREGGADASNPRKIPYALLLSLHAPDDVEIYEDVLKRYPGLLVQLQPKIAIPLRIM